MGLAPPGTFWTRIPIHRSRKRNSPRKRHYNSNWHSGKGLGKSDLYLSYNEYNLYRLPLSDTLTSLLKTSSYSKRTYTYTPGLAFKAISLQKKEGSFKTLDASNLSSLTSLSALPLNEKTFLEDLTLYSKYLKK